MTTQRKICVGSSGAERLKTKALAQTNIFSSLTKKKKKGGGRSLVS